MEWKKQSTCSIFVLFNKNKYAVIEYATLLSIVSFPYVVLAELSLKMSPCHSKQLYTNPIISVCQSNCILFKRHFNTTKLTAWRGRSTVNGNPSGANVLPQGYWQLESSVKMKSFLKIWYCADCVITPTKRRDENKSYPW